MTKGHYIFVSCVTAFTMYQLIFQAMGISERRAREKVRRREDIIDAAEKLFFEKGIEHTTMDDIAEGAELAKGTLYLYFGNKEDLRYAVAERGIQILNKMAATIPSDELNAIERLVALGRIFIQFARDYPNRFKILILMESIDIQKLSLSREQIVDSIYRESPIRLVTDFVKEGVETGLIRKDIPAEIIANTLWSQMFGVVQFAFVKSGVYELAGFTTEQLYENHLEIVLNGIKA